MMQWNPCSVLNLTSFDASTAGYWGERWELYKGQYALATLAYRNGIRKLEFWCDAA